MECMKQIMIDIAKDSYEEWKELSYNRGACSMDYKYNRKTIKDFWKQNMEKYMRPGKGHKDRSVA